MEIEQLLYRLLKQYPKEQWDNHYVITKIRSLFGYYLLKKFLIEHKILEKYIYNLRYSIFDNRETFYELKICPRDTLTDYIIYSFQYNKTEEGRNFWSSYYEKWCLYIYSLGSHFKNEEILSIYLLLAYGD